MENIFKKLKVPGLWKKKSLCLLFLFWSVLFLFCMIQIVKPCKIYHYDGNETFSGTSYEEKTIYEDISLSPGVYRIELAYKIDANLQGICNVVDGTISSGGVLSNGEPLYRGLSKTGYHIWLLEKTDGLQVQVSCSGDSNLTTGELEIVETNLLWTIILTLLVFVGVILLMAHYICEYNRVFPISIEKKQSFFLVMLIGLIASVPYLCGYNIWGADLGYHLQRIEGLKDGLLSGQFPVRLEPEWLCGHGYADAIFYCGTLLYFPALLRLLGFPVTTSYNIFCVALNLATAWIYYFCFYHIFRNRRHGIICSALYTLSIFRIYKLVITSAVGEASAFTFIPLVIYGLYRIFTENPDKPGYKTSWVFVMLGFSGLLQTHVLTCEITAFVMLLFCIINFRKLLRRNTLLELLKGGIAALAVSLWFLVPFLDYYMTQPVHIKYVSARTIQDRGLYLAQLAFHFWGGGGETTPLADNGMWHSYPVGIGMMLIAGLVLFLILWFSGKLPGKKEETSFAKKTALIAMLLLLMSLKIFPWDRIQSMNSVFAALVSSLQFPNRFLGWGTGCLVFLFGYCLDYLKGRHEKGYLFLLVLAFIGITTSDMYLLDYTNAEQSSVTLYNEDGMGVSYISGAEYILEGTEQADIAFSGPEAGEGVEIETYDKEYLSIDLQCFNNGTDVGFIDTPILYYKGYEAVDTDSGNRLGVCAGKNNVVRVMIPPGFNGHLKIRFVPPVYWRISELVSGVSCIGLMVLWYRNRRRKYVKA